MKALVILITLLAATTWAASPKSNYKSMPIGSDAVNTGFENLSCTQMIGNFLTYIGTSGLGQEGIDKRFKDCLTKSRSGFFGGAMSRINVTTDADKACLETANQEQRSYENAKVAFIAALAARQNIYNAKNVTNKNLLRECTPAKLSDLNRKSGESDSDLIRRAMFNCGISADAAIFKFNQFRDSYANKSDFEDYQVCSHYREEYDKERYPPLRISRESQQTAESAERPRIVCQALSCDKVLQPNAVNNPSPCYRNAVINCMTGAPANSGFPSVGGSVNTNQ